MGLIRTKDDIYVNVPEGMADDAPEIREVVNRERQQRMLRKRDTPEFKAKASAQQAADRELYDPTKGMSGIDKVRANVGAGMHSAWTGLKQITPGLKSPTDEEVRDKRAVDERLAQATDLGIGADWMPTAGSALQFGGEMLPSMAIPGGLGARAATMLPKAMAGRMTAQTLGGAAGGALSGALAPTTSDESRTLNTILGGGVGAMLPAAIGAGRAGLRNITAKRRAGGQLVEGLGEEADTMAQRLAARDEDLARRSEASGLRGAQAIPETLGEATGSVRAANIEARTGRSADANPEWADFKRQQNLARYEAVGEATGEAPLLESRLAQRKKVTDPSREKALKAAGKDPWFRIPAQKAAEDLLSSDEAVNPAVRRVADLVLSSMDERAAKAITPEGLYNVRKLLTDKLQGPAVIGDELSAAVKGADVQTIKLINAIDESLNAASGGRWQRYLDTFTRRSRPVDASKAAQLVRETFEAPGIQSLGGAPEVTMTRMGQALKASEGPARRSFPLALSAQARGGMEDVLEQVKRSNEVQKARKLAGTAGGGSDTAMNLAQNVASGAASTMLPAIARDAAGGVASSLGQATQRELAVMMQNPRAAIAAIKQAQALRRPLTEAQTIALQMLSAGAGGVLPRALEAQQQQPMR